MRILIHGINFFPELTGVGKYTGEMAEWLATRGHAVRIVTAPPHYPQWRVGRGYSAWQFHREKRRTFGDSIGSLEVFRCPIWVPRMPDGWQRIFYLASFATSSCPVMLRQIFWRPDIVLLIEPPFACAPQALSVARLSGASAWLHVQDFEVDAGFKLEGFSSSRVKRWAYRLERFLKKRFDRVSTISDRMVERLYRKGVDASKRVLFPNWVDAAVIHPLRGPSPFRKYLGIPDQAVVALYSGNMGKKQGLELLVEASRRLATRSEMQFVFCGEGTQRDQIAQMTSQANNVKFLPLQPADRLNDLLNLADIHLLPQRADAADLVMPSKLTGMLASGRPVVATAHRGTQLAEQLEGRGLIASPGDVNSFIAAANRLADDPDLRKRLGEEARKYAVRHLDRETILCRFEVCLYEACSQFVRPRKEKVSPSPPSKVRVT